MYAYGTFVVRDALCIVVDWDVLVSADVFVGQRHDRAGDEEPGMTLLNHGYKIDHGRQSLKVELKQSVTA